MNSVGIVGNNDRYLCSRATPVVSGFLAMSGGSAAQRAECSRSLRLGWTVIVFEATIRSRSSFQSAAARSVAMARSRSKPLQDVLIGSEH
jgi:hypothetical protein